MSFTYIILLPSFYANDLHLILLVWTRTISKWCTHENPNSDVTLENTFLLKTKNVLVLFQINHRHNLVILKVWVLDFECRLNQKLDTIIYLPTNLQSWKVGCLYYLAVTLVRVTLFVKLFTILLRVAYLLSAQKFNF